MLELARESDWEEVKRLSVQIHDIHATLRPDMYFHCDEPYPKEKFLEDIRNRMVYVTKNGSKVVGYVVLCIIQKGGPGTYEKKLLRLDCICVDKTVRGKGIGTSMVAAVRALAKAFGCSDVLLSVHPENEKAIPFYQKCGFKVRTINMEI